MNTIYTMGTPFYKVKTSGKFFYSVKPSGKLVTFAKSYSNNENIFYLCLTSKLEGMISIRSFEKQIRDNFLFLDKSKALEKQKSIYENKIKSLQKSVDKINLLLQSNP